MLEYSVGKKIYLQIFFLALLVRLGLIFRVIPALGTISSLIELIPLFAIFYLARRGALERGRLLINLSLLLTLIEAIYAMFFAYLRFLIIRPFISFVIGYVTGTRTVVKWFSFRLIPIYLLLALVISYFSLFGKERENLGVGINRIENLLELKSQNEDEGGQTIKGDICQAIEYQSVDQFGGSC